MRRPVFDETWPKQLQQTYLNDTREFFGDEQGRNFAPDYRARYMSRHLKIIEEVKANVPLGASILDIAAGNGNFSIRLSEAGYDVTWNDLREHLIDYVKEKDETGQLKYVSGNVFDLSSHISEAFDAIVATEIIEHVAHPDQFIRQLSNLIKPGGHLVMSTPNGAYFLNDLPRWSDIPDPSIFEADQFQPDGDGHLFLLYEDEIRLFAAQSGLEVVCLDFISNPLTVGQMKLRHLHKLMPEDWIAGLEQASRRLKGNFLRRFMKIMTFTLRKAP